MNHDHSVFLRPRRATRRIQVGSLAIGGGAPISVQSMAKTDTRNVADTIAQASELELLGCDLLRLAVPDAAAARALKKIKAAVRIPLVADVHFDHRLALLALESGVDGLRLNPGNIGPANKIREVVQAAKAQGAPSCNGWTFWHIEHEGEIKPIDAVAPVSTES